MQFDTNSLFYSYTLYNQYVVIGYIILKRNKNLGLQPTYIAQKTALI